MTRILLTGFEPFGGQSVNPAWEAVQRVRAPQDTDLRRLPVPVSFRDCTGVVLRAMEEWQPDILLCVGQAGGRSAVSPERLGINLDDARIPDNRGEQPQDRPIAAGGPNAIFSPLPVKAMAEAIRAAGLPGAVSDSAGTFVCNHLLYSLLLHCRERALPVRTGFIHVPFLPEQAASQPSMPLADIVRALEAALSVLV